MAAGGYRHILRNLSDELDWRPLHFVDRLPPAQVCSACGFVVRRTGSLACGHFLCGACYEQQRELAGPLCCPFDGEACSEGSIQWREFPAENLLERRVFCWNKDNGCSAAPAASELSRHFRLECKHHTASCPNCSTKILCNGLGLHLRSCTGHQGPTATEGVQGAGDNQQTAELTALKTTLSTVTLQMERQLADLKDLLERLSLESSLQTDQINELSHTINSLQEVQTDRGNALGRTMHDLKATLQRGLETVASQSRRSIARYVADIDKVTDAVLGIGGEIGQKMDVVLHNIVSPQSYRWTLEGYGSLKAEAMMAGWVERFIDAVYLGHYLIAPGVYLERGRHGLALHMKLSLNKGSMDGYLQWPFNRKVALSVVHPQTGEKRTIEYSPNGQRAFFSRPTNSCNAALYSDTYLYLNDLERDGYVKSNQLDLCFELLT